MFSSSLVWAAFGNWDLCNSTAASELSFRKTYLQNLHPLVSNKLHSRPRNICHTLISHFSQQDEACAGFSPVWRCISPLTHSQESKSCSPAGAGIPQGLWAAHGQRMEHPRLSSNPALWDFTKPTGVKKIQGTNPKWKKKTFSWLGSTSQNRVWNRGSPSKSDLGMKPNLCTSESLREEIPAATQSLKSQEKTQKCLLSFGGYIKHSTGAVGTPRQNGVGAPQ